MSQFAASAEYFARSVSAREARDESLKAAQRPRAGWSAETFAREQLRGLVHQLFLCAQDKRVRHVLFSAVNRETDSSGISQLVGEALALEKVGTVAVMTRAREGVCRPRELWQDDRNSGVRGLRHAGFRLKENFWLVPGTVEDRGLGMASQYAGIADLRREFDFSIVEGPIADSHEARTMLPMVDGIVLVVSARHTRKASARNVQRALESANARILGTVLIDRSFPIPENIYRRL
jgi:hypothetical protein